MCCTSDILSVNEFGMILH